MYQIRNASLLGVRKENAMDKESGMHEIGQEKYTRLARRMVCIILKRSKGLNVEEGYGKKITSQGKKKCI
jgi:hypothetical protein